MQREGSWARIAWSGGKLSTMETVGHVVRVTKQLTAEPGLNGWVTMAVDADGLGAGVYDRLIELGYSVGEIRGGKTSVEPEDYVNRRSEWYWKLRLRFESGDIDIDPYDKELAKHLRNIKWNGAPLTRVSGPPLLVRRRPSRRRTWAWTGSSRTRTGRSASSAPASI
ncbi:MAG TPA: hypothetical protein VI030_13305, partial [Propionibacteriaceae bacterium]